MRFLLLTLSAALLVAGCAQRGQPDPREACRAQGHAPGTEEWRVCMDAGGAKLATGPGSPYANADEEED